MSPVRSLQTITIVGYAVQDRPSKSSFLKIFLVFLSLAIVSAGREAGAQPLSPARPVSTFVPSGCRAAAINGAQFMQRLNAILVHGNLADVKYNEIELGTKFNLTSGSMQSDGMQGDYIYDTDQHFGGSINADLNIGISYGGGSETVLGIGELPPTINFVDECFRLPLSAFISRFGDRFSTGYMGGQERWWWNLPGPNNSTFGLTVATDEEKLVSEIVIQQDTPTSSTAFKIPPPFCKKYTLTRPQFLSLLHATVDHGDLTDIAYLQEILGTKLDIVPSYGVDGKPDPDETSYRSDHVLGGPIPVEIEILRGKTEQEMGGKIASMQLGGPNPDFYFYCLKATVADFMSSFGRRIFSNFSMCSPGGCGGFSGIPNTQGKGDTKLEMEVEWNNDSSNPYNPRTFQDMIVTSITISELPR